MPTEPARPGTVGGVTSTSTVRVRAAAKVNLGLAVGRVGADGYHPLATVFQAVSVHDDLTAAAAEPGSGVALEVSGRGAESVPLDARNLAVRAALLLAERTGVEPDVALSIRKAIPVAGGMAGGSADAAAALVACDSLWGTGLARPDLLDLAAELGADVPFAVAGNTAVGTGRGDQLSPVMCRGQYHWAFATRRAGLSTPQVYATFDALGGAGASPEPEVDPALIQALRAGDAEGLGAALHNDLQHAAIELAPELVETLALAEDNGALGAIVSGSGPTVAALARSSQHALAIAAALTAAGAADDVVCAVGPVPGARVVER